MSDHERQTQVLAWPVARAAGKTTISVNLALHQKQVNGLHYWMQIWAHGAITTWT